MEHLVDSTRHLVDNMGHLVDNMRRPVGVQGAKIVYALLDAPPATEEELTLSARESSR
jgi:hypothetical protein